MSASFQVNIYRNNTGYDEAVVEPFICSHKTIHQLDRLESVTEFNVFSGTEQECQQWATSHNMY